MNYRKDPNHENNSMVLEWTSERYLPFVDPKICGAEIHYEHLHRSYFALYFVKDKKVIDLACGEGYGCYTLSKSAGNIIGLDIDELTIKHAPCKYTRDNLEFMHEWPIKDLKMIILYHKWWSYYA